MRRVIARNEIVFIVSTFCESQVFNFNVSKGAARNESGGLDDRGVRTAVIGGSVLRATRSV